MPLPFPAHNVSPVRIAAERLPTPRLPDEVFAPNTALRHARRLFEGHVVGSESVAVAPDGSLWMLDKWGYVWVATASGDDYSLDAQPLAYVGPGRPLGFHFTANGDLAICNSLSGLMLLERPAADSTKWRLRCLSNTAGGRPVSYANDLTIGSAGRIYFSDSSTIPPALNQAGPRPWYDTLRSFMLTLWHGGPTGRLLCYDPSTDATTVLADGLWYANGVALAADESFVAVVETCSMRVRRHWLKGPKAGSMDTLIDRLPGWPDNIVESSDGGFWLCLVLPDMPLVHKVLPQPWLRSLVAKLPEWLLPPKPQWGCVLRLSAQGEVVQALTDPDGRHVSHISSVTEHADKLFVGNLAKDYVSVLDLRAVEEPH